MSKNQKQKRRKFIYYVSALLVILTLSIVITKEFDHNVMNETASKIVQVHSTMNHTLKEKDSVSIVDPLEDDTDMEPREEMNNDEDTKKENAETNSKEKENVRKEPEQKEEEKKEEEPKSPEGPFAFPSLEENLQSSDDAVPVITNPTSFLLIVNKERKLPDGFIPPDLTVPNVRFSFSGNDEKRYLRKEAAEALEFLFSAAEKDGVHLYAVSGYRSFNRQTTLFNHYVSTMGRSEAERVSARPGTSEHQTGLAMDVSSKAMNFRLDQSFGNTIEGKWLKDNAYKHGYIIRYPQGKEPITGYTYEPWHLRYVGITAASYIQQFDLTLEEIAGKSF
ncbi:M15 family metallopeptidase [Evansella sp. AB-rgal1]|uniref:M15 family metallopeptidase n=1 Tax=Evansella sp. AB-rgal1 TaxID=3242696 RepID=UPI00359CDEE6